MADKNFKGPPQSADFCKSKPKTRASNSAQRVERLGFWAAIVAGSAEVAAEPVATLNQLLG